MQRPFRPTLTNSSARFVPAPESLEDRALPAPFAPTTVAELVTAINTANANNQPDTIDLGGRTFTLTTVQSANRGGNGLPDITADNANPANTLTINGNGGTIERDAAAPGFRLLLQDGGVALLNGITFRNGLSAVNYDGGGIRVQTGAMTLTNCTITGNQTDPASFSGNGGGLAVRPGATANLIGCVVSNNTAASSGGGLSTYGTLNVMNTVITGNTATKREGGGLTARFYQGQFGTVNVTNSTISNNKTLNTLLGDGGGIASNAGAITIVASTISGNTAAGDGGGVFSGPYVYNPSETGQITVTNSTISGNTGFNGGGAAVRDSTLTLNNSTVTANKTANEGEGSRDGGGVISIPDFATSLTLQSTIVAGNTDPAGGTTPDVSGAFNANFCLIGDGSGGVPTGANNQIGTAAIPIDPLLGPLLNNGGPTLTHALLPESPALNTGSNPLALATDQRGAGFPRSTGQTDIGAFELVVPPPITGFPAKITSVTSSTAAGKFKAGETITVSVNFDKPVTLTSGTLTINLDTGGTVIISPFTNKTSASGTYTVEPGQNTRTLDSTSLVVSGGALKDGVGNTIPAAIPLGKSLANLSNLLIDTIAPTVTLSNPSAAAATTGPITYTVNYADANFNANTLTAADITLNKTGTANGTVSVSGGAGLFKTVTISNITGTGTLGISLAAGTASDTAGNLAPAAGPSAKFNVTNPPLPGVVAFAVGGADGTVRLLSGTGSVISTVTPIEGYTGLVSVALGDFNNDTVADLVVASASPAGVAGLTAPDAGKVFVYDGVAAAKGTLTLVKTFTPFTNHAGPDGTTGAYTNGLNIAVGDVDGDTHDDVIAGTRGGNGTTSGQVEFGRLVVVDGESAAIIGGIQTPFGPTYQKGVIVAAGNVDGLDGSEISVTRGGPVASTNPAVKTIKVKVLQLQGTDLTELPLNADGTTAFAPFAELTGAASGISRDGRVAFVDSDGDGKDELVFTALDPLTSTTNTQVRVGVFAIDPTASKSAATIISTGPDKGTYVTGNAVKDHAITHAAATGAQQNIALLTESAASGMVFLAPLTGVVQTGGFSLTIATGGITLDGI